MTLARKPGSSLFVVAAACGAALAGEDESCQSLESYPGVVQEFVFSGARPGGRIGLFVAGPEGAVTIGQGHLVGVALADHEGIARWNFAIPAELTSTPFQLQAWQAGSSQPGGSLALSGLGDSDFFIDFEGTALAPGEIHSPPDLTPVIYQGYSFAPTLNGTIPDIHVGNQVSFWPSNGTTTIGGHDEILLTRADGAPFTIGSFDFSGFPLNMEIPFSVTSSSGAVANFVPDGLVDGPGGVEDFETFFLPATGFDNVTSVLFRHSGPGTTQGNFDLDNLVLRPGPAGVMNLSGAQTQKLPPTPPLPGEDDSALIPPE